MNILVACEFSGLVRDAFRAKGHNAVSCDLEPSERPGPHYQGDVRGVLEGDWDMIIAFPPCTHLCRSGARWFKAKQADGRQQEAIDFFLLFTDLSYPRVAIDNPVCIISTLFHNADIDTQPYHISLDYTQLTQLWCTG